MQGLFYMFVTKAIYVIGIACLYVSTWSTVNSAGYLQRVQTKPFIGEMFTLFDPLELLTWLSLSQILKQTCLGQGLGVPSAARKRPSKAYVHHEGLRS